MKKRKKSAPLTKELPRGAFQETSSANEEAGTYAPEQSPFASAIQEIWNDFREMRRILKESSEENAKRWAEDKARWAEDHEKWEAEKARWAEEAKRKEEEDKRRAAEWDKLVQENERSHKRLENLFTGEWGKLMESLVEGDLIQLLNQRGIPVRDTLCNRKYHYDNDPIFPEREFDIIAVDGDTIVVVEVKTTLKTDDVNYFLEKLGHIHHYIHEYADKKVIGAITYLRSSSETVRMATRKGLLVIRATSYQRVHCFAKRIRAENLLARFGPPAYGVFAMWVCFLL